MPNPTQGAVHPGIAKFFEGKKLEELEVVEHGGRQLFRETIKRRTPAGLVEVPVVVNVPRKSDRGKARATAIVWARKEKIDRTADADIFEDFDTIALLARCIRKPEPPYELLALPEFLADAYDDTSLWDLVDRLAFYRDLTDPRVLRDPSVEEFWTIIGMIARCQNTSPLLGMPGSAQVDFVTRMAETLWTYRPEPSPSPSRETSTPER